MGGDTTVQAAQQPDYSAAISAMSQNQMSVQMAQIGAQIIAMYQMSADREAQLAVQLETALDRYDTKLEIARMNYMQAMTVEENRHIEKMTEIDKEAAEVEIARLQSNRTETGDLLTGGDGGYEPGRFWDSAVQGNA